LDKILNLKKEKEMSIEEKINWKSIIKLLKDKENWKFTNSIFGDEIEHISGIRFYLDQHGVVFRNRKDEIVYESNLLVYILTIIYSIKLKKYLQKVKKDSYA
jgi:hypothetical protein